MDTVSNTECEPTFAGPYSSFDEFEVAKKKFEEFYSVQLNRSNISSLEAYTNKCPNRSMNMNLKYQSFALLKICAIWYLQFTRNWN